MSYEANTIALTVDEGEENVEPMEISSFDVKIEDSDLMDVIKHDLYGNMPFRDHTLSEEHEELLEKFPSKNIGDIRKIENMLGREKYDITEICLQNNIQPEELNLLNVFFGNRLKTVSRDGITIIDIDDSLEIRNDEDKFLSPSEKRKVRNALKAQEKDDDFVYPGHSSVEPVTPSDYTPYTTAKQKQSNGGVHF